MNELTNSNAIDLLLATDSKDLKIKPKEVEVARLSEVMGKPFVVELRALPLNLEIDIDERTNKIKYDSDGELDMDIRAMEQKKLILVESVHSDGKPLFKQSELIKKFNAKTPAILVEKIFNKGEINKLYDEYRELTGFKKDSVKQIKN